MENIVARPIESSDAENVIDAAEVQELIIDTPDLATEESAEAVASVVEEAPVVEAPAPVVEAPAPVVEAPAPVVEAPISNKNGRIVYSIREKNLPDFGLIKKGYTKIDQPKAEELVNKYKFIRYASDSEIKDYASDLL